MTMELETIKIKIDRMVTFGVGGADKLEGFRV